MSEDEQTLEQGDVQLDPSNLDAESLATLIPDELVVKVAGKVAEQITPILSRTFESRIDARIEEITNQIDRKLEDINTNLWNKTQEYLAKVVDKTRSEALGRVANPTSSPTSATRGSANKKHITVTPEALKELKQQYANEQGQWESFFRDIVTKRVATNDPAEMAKSFTGYLNAMEQVKQEVAKSMGYGSPLQPTLENLAQERLDGIKIGLDYNLRDTLRRGGFRDEIPFDLPLVDKRKSVNQSGKNSGNSSASPNWGREGKGISVKGIYRRDGKG